jgi:thiosulfate/3-mercaptopyruvate sulfurtransferase
MEPSFRADLADVKSACALGDAIIWDTRSQPEYTGQEKRGHRHQGHIAGAVHLDWRDLMDRETHRFKSPSELSELLARAGIAPDKPVYAY